MLLQEEITASKFVEMEEELTMLVMMEIIMLVMDVLECAQLKLDTDALEEEGQQLTYALKFVEIHSWIWEIMHVMMETSIMEMGVLQTVQSRLVGIVESHLEPELKTCAMLFVEMDGLDSLKSVMMEI